MPSFNAYRGRPRKGTPQTQPIPGTFINNAGGYVFKIDPWEQFNRFLILGTVGGTYYVSQTKLTDDAIKVVAHCWAKDPSRAYTILKDISLSGRAPSNDPAIFAMAIGSASAVPQARAYALTLLPSVARIGTHLFHFMDAIKSRKMRGFGRGLQSALQRWYTVKDAPALAMQLIKYQSRDGWSHRDILRLARPTPDSTAQGLMYQWVTKGELWKTDAANLAATATDAEKAGLMLIEAFEAVKKAKTAKEAIPTIMEYGLPRECVPTQFLKDPAIWEALLPRMGLTAMLRNLGNMTRSGLVKPNSEATKFIAGKINDADELKRARIHPFSILLALKTYGAGKGFRSENTWTPVQAIVGALDKAFYLAFKNVKPTGKRYYIGLDVSGSMSFEMMDSPLTVREGSVAMAMVTARAEEQVHMAAFSDRMNAFSIQPGETLAAACNRTARLPWSGTDCALPMLDAMKKDIEVDTFLIYTDNETWAGGIHPVKALAQYRKRSGINARLIVVGMTATEFSIADPNDPLNLDVVGFDSNTPAVIAEFSR